MKWLYKTFKSDKPSTFNDELSQCRTQVEFFLNNSTNMSAIVRLNIFVGRTNVAEFLNKKEEIRKAIEPFKSFQFIYEIIAQKPSDRQIAMKAMSLNLQGIEYKKELTSNPAFKALKVTLGESFIYLTTTASFIGKTTIDSTFCFDNTLKNLQKQKLDFGNVVRQWNFVGGIVDERDEDGTIIQNYQEFNDARSVYYKKSNFQHGYPSATGIGMDVPGVIVQTISISNNENVQVIAIDNPSQKPAHEYSENVLIGDSCDCNKTTPKFERAKAILGEYGDWVFVSGTAAIEGELHKEEQNIEMQTKQTLELINKLVSTENLKSQGIEVTGKTLVPATFRAYVKNELDATLVKNACINHFGDIPGLVFKADICRCALLVEIECEYLIQPLN